MDQAPTELTSAIKPQDRRPPKTVPMLINTMFTVGQRCVLSKTFATIEAARLPKHPKAHTVIRATDCTM